MTMTDPYQPPALDGPAGPPTTPGYPPMPGYAPGGPGYPHPGAGAPYQSPVSPYPGGPPQYQPNQPNQQYQPYPPSQQYQPGQPYPPSGANPYGPPGYRPPVPRRTNTGLIVALVVVGALVLVGGAVGVFLLTRSGSDATPAVAPKDTVDAFLTATFKNKDTAGAMTKVCDGKQAAIQSKIDSVNKPATSGTVTVTWERTTEEVRGKQAAVSTSASMKVSGGSGGFNPNLVALWFFSLSIEHGAWKICTWV
jgi:hypothetical protein